MARSDSRVLLFTGKGGVGKTTTAAATAITTAARGARTILLSTDPAHSVADCLDVHMGSTAQQVDTNLWAQQLDAQERFEDSWYEIQDWLREVMDWAGVEAIEAEELALLPGLDEVFALADIRTYAESGEWDVVVVDCGPTAETIRFLSLPDVMSWYMERLFPVSRRVNKVLSPVVSRLSSLPVAKDHVFAAAHRFYERIDGVRGLLTDPTRTSVRLVVNPERMVIAEARRTHTYLSLFGYHTDAVVVNRVLPPEAGDGFLSRWREVQAGHLAAIDDGFRPLPVRHAPLASDEIYGVEALRAFGDQLWADLDPGAMLHEGASLSVERDEVADGWVLSMPLPFATGEDLDLGRSDAELHVRVGPYRRALVLPDSLRRLEVSGARIDKDRLVVSFNGATRTPGTGGSADV